MTLREAMERISYREYLTWTEYFRSQWNEPDRTDHYLMSIAAEVRRANERVRYPNSVKAEHFKLKFVPASEPVEPEVKDKQALSELSRSVWFARLGMSKDGKPVSTRDC